MEKKSWGGIKQQGEFKPKISVNWQITCGFPQDQDPYFTLKLMTSAQKC